MVTVPQIRNEIIELTGMPRSDVESVLNMQYYLLKKHMLEGEKVQILYGIFITPKFQEEHEMTLPKGEKVVVPAHYNYRIKLGKNLLKIDRLKNRFETVEENGVIRKVLIPKEEELPTEEVEEGYEEFNFPLE
jgi:nucleoid DNA-binding protein